MERKRKLEASSTRLIYKKRGDRLKQYKEENINKQKVHLSVNKNSLPTIVQSDITPDGSTSTSNIANEPSCINFESNFSLKGSRIVDVAYFFEQLQELSFHEPLRVEGNHCGLRQCKIINEQRHGFSSTLIFECLSCNQKFHVKCQKDSRAEEVLNLNTVAVSAMVATGNGFSQLQEIMTTLDIPCMSAPTYTKHQEKLFKLVHETAWDSMHAAAIEESKLAISAGDINDKGIPFITVVADGSWSKRSYKSNYDALSGVACIIGYKTKKVLFIGIRNKYCSYCAKYESNKLKPPVHICYKNWNGTSTSMESDIIVEGFRKSIQMYNLIYLKLIGDGDSSVHRKLLESKPYGNLLVEKIECRNHLLRNYCSRLRELCTRRNSSLLKPVSVQLRNVVKNNIMRLRTGIQCAIRERNKAHNNNTGVKILFLQKDIKNSISHVFGEHLQCREIGYFCKRSNNEINWIPAMRDCGLWNDLQNIISRLLQNTSSLLHDVDNNAAESYNSIVAKFIGGKRINFSLRGSYGLRCEAAALSYNEGHDYHCKIFETSNCSTTFYVNEHARKKKTLSDNSKLKRLLHPRYKNKKKHIEADEDYGLVSIQDEDRIPDLSEEEYEIMKINFLASLDLDELGKKEIEINTRGQSSNPKWNEERMKRITCSNFGRICKIRKATSCVNIVKTLLYNGFKGNFATRYGLENEITAITTFMEKTNLTVVQCGLMIHEQIPYLAGSPDGLIENKTIVEIKCPFKAKNIKPEDANLDFLDAAKKLKQNHSYFYQIQGLLEITNRDICYFVVWSNQGFLIEEIVRDRMFWETKMKKQLQCFYMECLLPELVDPRVRRNMPIRNPPRSIA